MRTISGYSPEQPERSLAIQVVCTPIGGSPTDITDVVQAVEVTDTLQRSPSEARVTLARQPEGWSDPIGDPASPLSVGSRLSIRMGERGGIMTQVFEGEISGGGTDSDDPLARTSIQAVSGYASWWSKAVTSPVYENADSDDIVEDLFTRWGKLSAPGDFDLPGASRILGYLQSIEQPIMPIAFDIYEPTECVPWWDPVQEKLSTLPCDIPSAADLTLAPVLRGGLSLSWARLRGTRVCVQAGTLRGITRIEIGEWTTPANLPGGDFREEGVRWASGNKSDWAYPPYWAKSDESGIHYGQWQAGDCLWIHFIYDSAPSTGNGYLGPEGIRFVMNNPAISTDPVSAVQIRAEEGGIDDWAAGKPYLERWSEAGNCQVAAVKVMFHSLHLWTPPPNGYTPGAYWDIWRNDSDEPLHFDLIGRQRADDSLEQLSAQAWDDALIAAHGDILVEVRNDALLEATDPLVAVEAEAERQLAVIKVAQHPANLTLRGQDLRLLPGDCIRTPHPRDAYDVLLWAQQVKHTWSADGRGGTEVWGYVVETIS